MQYRRLGGSDLEVSVICQGCWSLVSDDFNWGSNALEDSLTAIRASMDEGVNFFDTAPGYGSGESEEILGRALKDDRKKVLVATKVTPKNLEPSKLKAACEASLKRLGMDVIDLYQVHWPNPDVPVADTMGAMRELVEAGTIRAAGVSNFGMSYLRDVGGAGQARCESNQLCYSLLYRGIELEVLPKCLEKDMSILAYSPLAQGLLAGKFASADDVPESRARTRLFDSAKRSHARHGESGCEEVAFAALEEIRGICEQLGEPMDRVSLAWVLAQKGLASAIVGGRNPQQARDNAKAADLQLDDATLEALSRATEPIRQHLGANADIWQHDSRMERPNG